MEPAIDLGDRTAMAALASRASLSGIQPKLFAVKDGRSYRPARRNESSTFIAKLPSGPLRDIVENEYLTTAACRALLPGDEIAWSEVANLEGIDQRALVVKRFDRLPSGAKRHFEEFNQLLGKRSGDDKYHASCDDMAKFILKTPGCTPVDAWRLFRRILVCFLTGNTDAHLKNYAMFHTGDGLRLTPAYDLVAAALYPEYRQIALAVGNAANLELGSLAPKHIVALSESYGLGKRVLTEAIAVLERRRKAAEKAVADAARRIGEERLARNLLDFMERRWNGTFKSIGPYLLKKPSAADTA